MSRTESKTLPMWMWRELSESYLEKGWRVRGYELHGPLSQPTHVDIERDIQEPTL